MTRARAARGAVVAVVVVVVGGAACTRMATSLSGHPGPEAGLLRGTLPLQSQGVTHVDRLTDGIAAAPDDPPRSELTALFGTEASVVYDLGRELPIHCAAIDADGDDRYDLTLSTDGQTFKQLWSAAPTGDRGMQPQSARDLNGVGRYLRVTAAGGDGVYAIAELSVAGDCPPRWPPPLAMQRGTRVESSLTLKLWAFGALAALFILGYRPKLPDFVKLLGAVPAGLAIAAAIQLAEVWPPSRAVVLPLVVSLVAVAAALALRLVLRAKTAGSRHDEAILEEQHVAVRLERAGGGEIRVVVRRRLGGWVEMKREGQGVVRVERRREAAADICVRGHRYRGEGGDDRAAARRAHVDVAAGAAEVPGGAVEGGAVHLVAGVVAEEVARLDRADERRRWAGVGDPDGEGRRRRGAGRVFEPEGGARPAPATGRAAACDAATRASAGSGRASAGSGHASAGSGHASAGPSAG